MVFGDAKNESGAKAVNLAGGQNLGFDRRQVKGRRSWGFVLR